MSGTLHLIHGYIGAGKTTFAKQLEEETEAIRFTLDEWMENFYGHNPDAMKFDEYQTNCENMILDILKSILKHEQSAILDFGFWSKLKRENYRRFANENNAKTILYNLKCDDEIALKRTLRRTSEMPKGSLYIDENAYINLKTGFDPVEEDERCIIIY